jgi:glycosyltransferase involved in cell wall biosynthesis
VSSSDSGAAQRGSPTWRSQHVRLQDAKKAGRSPGSLALGMAAMADPEDPAASSGWPASVLGALRELVERVVPVSDTPYDGSARAALAAGAVLGLRPSDLGMPSRARQKLWTVGQASWPYAVARASAVRRGLASAGALDGFVQNGGDYRGPPGIPMVTYQDSTVVQAVEAYPWPHLRGLSRSQVNGLVRRQRAAYRSAVACCTFSHWVADSIISDYGIPASKVHVVGLGSNASFAEAGDGDRQWSTPRFLFVGFDWRRKNGELVLDAFTRVRERFPDATLDLVGGHPRVALDGVRGHGLLAMNDAEERARLTALYRQATVFVMPSLHEPAGTVHVEAAAAGIPSIGTSNGGAATCIGDAGRVVDPGAARQLFEAMVELADPDTAQRLGALAREHAGQFTWRKVAERLLRALNPPGVDLAGCALFL